MVVVSQFLVLVIVDVSIVPGCRYDSCVHRSRDLCICRITLSKVRGAGEASPPALSHAELAGVRGVSWVTQEDQTSPVLENK